MKGDKENNLLPCPLCGSIDFDEFEGSDTQATAIYCCNCAYGVEDDTKTLKQLRKIHNTRFHKNE